MMKNLTYPLFVLLAIALVACGGPAVPDTPQAEPSPVISSFTAAPADIQEGDGTTLAWEVTGATHLLIMPGAFDVTGTDELRLIPDRSTVYTLTARNAAGASVKKNVTVTVDNEPPVNGPEDPPIARFDFSDAIGLQLGRLGSLGLQSVSPMSAANSGLLKVTESGSLEDPLVEGNLIVRDFFIRNGHVYMLLESYTHSGEPSACVLAEIDRDGLVTCVDADLTDIDVRSIQFDAEGGIYYRGYTHDYRTVIRRSENGVATDYYRAPDATQIYDFLVTRDGIVIAHGLTSGSMGSTGWVRAIEQSGFTRNLGLESLVDFLPDGSLLGADDREGLLRLMLHSDLEMDPRPYACRWYWEHCGELNPRFGEDTEIPNAGELRGARDSGRLYRTTDEVVALTPGGLYRIYPVAERFALPLESFTNGDIGIGLAVVSGSDASKEPHAYTVDLATGQTRDILGGRRIDVLRLNLQQDRQRVMLYGLDLDRNQPVLGEYDLALRRLEIADVERELAESFDILDWNISHVAPEPTLWYPEPHISVAWPSGWRDGMVELDASATLRFAFIERFEWDFGDGTTASGAKVAHGYRAPGTYSVTLTATNDVGQASTITEQVVIDQPANLLQVAVYGNHTLVLVSSGEVYAFGSNDWGQLGDGSTVRKSIPVAVSGLPEPAIAIAAGSYHSLALTESGDVYAWGEGGSGALGTGSFASELTAVRVGSLPAPVTQIAAGGNRSFAITDGGDLYAWGQGPLGNGDSNQSANPVRVEISSSVIQVAAGHGHTLALTMDGRVFAWGWNGSGEVGVGDTASYFAPVELATLTEPIAWVGAGGEFSLALTTSGQLYSWGANHSGQLGDGTSTNQTLPKIIDLASPVVTVAAGGAHVLAILAGNEVVAWGSNSGGQLGIGSWVPYFVTTPTNIGVSSATQLIAGEHTSAAIDGSDSLLLWGYVPLEMVGSEEHGDYRLVPTVVR